MRNVNDEEWNKFCEKEISFILTMRNVNLDLACLSKIARAVLY